MSAAVSKPIGRFMISVIYSALQVSGLSYAYCPLCEKKDAWYESSYFADLKGPPGIDQPEMVEPSNAKLYQKGRAFMTEDVNSAVRGLGRSGAQQVDVFDGHGVGTISSSKT